METENITGRFKRWIFFGITIPLACAAAIGYGAFKHYHSPEIIQIENAKVTGTLVSARTLVDGKVSEIVFEDGAEVRAGDVIARLEVETNEEVIAQLENTVELAKLNYEELKLGQTVKVPVKRVRVIPGTSSVTYQPGSVSSAELASLEERANRMSELFEMGAVSKIQRDAAIAAYENARANAGSTPIYTQSEPTYIEEIDYVDQWQPTPAAVLQNAENAIKQAELSLKVAMQEAQETEVTAPVNGTIYYSAEIEKELIAGNSIAKIGDSNELWLEAEVSEDIFNVAMSDSSGTYRMEPRRHVVKSGETLSAIARKYSTTATTIANLNKISLNSTLRIGQSLIVGYKKIFVPKPKQDTADNQNDTLINQGSSVLKNTQTDTFQSILSPLDGSPQSKVVVGDSVTTKTSDVKPADMIVP